jgi:transcriptional regulator with XRE-family HTH domain
MTTTISELSNLQKVLANLLEAAGNLSGAELARRLSLPGPTITRLLCGSVKNPRASTLSVIAEYFDVSINQLLGMTPLPTATECPPVEKTVAIPLLTVDEARSHQKHMAHPSDWFTWIYQEGAHIKDLFALHIMNDDWSPSFPAGTILVIHTQLEALAGDYLLVRFTNDNSLCIKKFFLEGSHPYLYPLRSELNVVDGAITPYEVIGVVGDMHITFRRLTKNTS